MMVEACLRLAARYFSHVANSRLPQSVSSANNSLGHAAAAEVEIGHDREKLDSEFIELTL